MKTPYSSSHQKEECSFCSTRDVPHKNRDCMEASDPTSSSPSSSAAAAATTTVAEQSISSVERLLASINDLLETRVRSDAQLRHQTDKKQEMMSEWITAAAVIDRFCFIIFSLCFLIGTVVMFVCAMSVQR